MELGLLEERLGLLNNEPSCQPLSLLFLISLQSSNFLYNIRYLFCFRYFLPPPPPHFCHNSPTVLVSYPPPHAAPLKSPHPAPQPRCAPEAFPPPMASFLADSHPLPPRYIYFQLESRLCLLARACSIFLSECRMPCLI